jgi:hypothetical protein
MLPLVRRKGEADEKIHDCWLLWGCKKSAVFGVRLAMPSGAINLATVAFSTRVWISHGA